MREADKQEVKAEGNHSPLSALGSSYFLSTRCYTVTVDDSPEVMFGVVDLDNFGGVWLLGTDVVFSEVPKKFLRESKKWLAKLSEPYEIVGNFVDSRNVVHRRWLEWLGFVGVSTEEAFGYEKRPFIKYIRYV